MAEETATPSGALSIGQIGQYRERLLGEIGKVIVGQKEVVENVITSFFAGGHCLITGVPGLAKTLLISSLGKAMDLKFTRVQFTPDLMPSDLTGTEVLEEDLATGARNMRFRPGPLFTQILLADEINRTPPKTQGALLEAMEERQVTVSGQTYQLPAPFFVLATQNPVEQEGTYPLPPVQQDRFMFSLVIDYLPRDEEVQVVNSTTGVSVGDIQKVLGGAELLACQELVRATPVAEPILRYAVSLVAASRPRQANPPDFVRDYVAWGSSIRGSHYLILAAKARAVLAGRHHVSLQDVQAGALPVLRNRIITNFRAASEGVNADVIVAKLLKAVPAPASGL
ncbi:MAG: AAA family ATPase [Lentisphaeria bacterium]|jgi:MoxR-like ATPase